MTDIDYDDILERASNPDPDKKCCTRCNRIKSSHEYHLRPASRDGLLGHCKKCVSEDGRKWRKKNPEVVRARNALLIIAKRERSRALAAESLDEKQRMAMLVADCNSWAKK